MRFMRPLRLVSGKSTNYNKRTMIERLSSNARSDRAVCMVNSQQLSFIQRGAKMFDAKKTWSEVYQAMKVSY